MMRQNMSWLRTGLLVFSLAASGFGAQPAVPADLPQAFAGLVELFDGRTWSPVEWAQGSVQTMEVFGYGAAGLPYMRSRFDVSSLAHETFLSGVYLTVHGKEPDWRAMRLALEEQPVKQAWLKQMVGDTKGLNQSMEAGAQWQPAVRLLPSTTGARRFTQLCIQSDDALVRRAGLYWGYWLADNAYWLAAKQCAQSDPDPRTRFFAQYFMRQGHKM
jgi:hypothetical protein